MKYKFERFTAELVRQGHLSMDIENRIGISLPSLDITPNPILVSFLNECVKLAVIKKSSLRKNIIV